MTKVKIANKKRFIRFLVLLFILFGLIFSFTVNAVNNKSVKEGELTKKEDELTKKEQEFLAQYEQVKIFIYLDQTAWGIQKELAPNSDVRKLLYYDAILNKINMGKIKSGETLVFLKERN